MPPIVVNSGAFRRELLPKSKQPETPPVPQARRPSSGSTNSSTNNVTFDPRFNNKDIRSLERAYETTRSRVDYLWDSYNEATSSTGFINQESLYIMWQLNTAHKDFHKEWMDVLVRGLIITEFPRLAVETYLKNILASDAEPTEEVHRWTDHLFGILINFSEFSEHFRNAVAETGVIEKLIGYLSNGEAVMAASRLNRRKENLIDFMLALLYNLSSGFRMRHRFTACGASKVLEAYFKYVESTYIRVVAVMTGARIDTGWPEASQLWSPDDVHQEGILYLLFQYLSSAYQNENRRFRGITVEEIAECLRLLAVTDKDKELLVSLGILRHAGALLNSTVEAEQSQGIDLLFAVCSGKTNSAAICSAVIESDEECMQPLRYLAEHGDFSDDLKDYANRFLQFAFNAVAKADDKATTLAGKATSLASQLTPAKQKPTVFLSYNKHDVSKIKRIERLLIGNDFKVVNSEKMSPEEALQKASIVAICHSFAYNQSPNCRREAELAVSFQKKIVSVRIEKDYEPEGWLDQLLEVCLVHVEGDDSLSQMGSGNKLLQHLARLLAD